MRDLLDALWAKKEESSDQTEWLPLLQHLEDTSRVCGFLWDHWLSDGQKQTISVNNEEELGRQIVVFLGAVHDLGKATPVFQIKGNRFQRSDLDIELLEKLELAGAKGISEFKPTNARESPHSIAGEALLELFDKRFTSPKDISSIVGGHHGRPTSEEVIKGQLLAYSINYFQEEIKKDDLPDLWEERESGLAGYWVRSQRRIFEWALERAGFRSASEIPPLSVPAQVQALGLLTMADWIASNTGYFPLIDINKEEKFDPQLRMERGLSKWFRTYGWLPEMPQSTEEAFKHRFSFHPRTLQKVFLDTISKCQHPRLFILEAPMGEGKTEAALMGAEELACMTGRRGLFFGLPTQATSNGIFPRIESWLESIYQDSGSKNELRLIHGKANLNKEYMKLTAASHIADDADKHEAFVVNQWFSGKKTAILDDFVVGTVDQFLMVALKQKHLALRQLAFAKKVVVIDEVHAYDAYMSQYLKMALTWMASYQVPVILLSATLSTTSRADLIKAYLRGLGVPTKNISIEGEDSEALTSSQAYPLISYVDGQRVSQMKEFSVSKGKVVSIQRIEDEQISGVIDQTFLHGGNIGIIVNTVKRAQELAQYLSSQYGEELVELLHSSFLATERTEKETELMRMLGKEQDSYRPKKKIIVGTQVIEQSLDIDFDLMISELAPVDLLIQRLGRLHRHNRIRPDGCQSPKLYLLGANDNLEFSSGSLAVYGGYLLARTQYFLGDQIRLPEDISPLVQVAYGKNDLDLEVGLREKYEQFEQKKDELTKQKKDRAKNYRLSAPYLSLSRIRKVTLHNWLDNPTKDSSEESGNSQVRDADESIEVIALRKIDTGYSLLFDVTDSDISLQITEPEQAMRVAGQTLRLPKPLCLPYKIEKTIHELEDLYLEYFKDWDCSPWLKGSLGILFDDQMNCRLNGYLLHYDRKYGLSYEKEEGNFGKV